MLLTRIQVNTSNHVVGVNTLALYISKMFKDADICTEKRNITNHSGRVLCCSALYDA